MKSSSLAPQGQTTSPSDRQRKLADERAQRVTLILDELRGHEALIEPSRLVSLAMSLRYALKRLEAIKEGWQ